MLFLPGNTAALQKNIDHYWVVKDTASVFGNGRRLLGFPGITPDLILVLDGHYFSTYEGKRQKVKGSYLYSFIHSKVEVDLSGIESFVLVKFKAKGLSSLLPFVPIKAQALIQNSVVPAEALFGPEINVLAKYLRELPETDIAPTLDEWFQTLYKREREGFIVNLAEAVSPTFDLKEIRGLTNYSYSTLERYFKKDTGLSPKQFQSLLRCKGAIQEICVTRNTDWLHYVTEYGYFDQPHFIKEVKAYSGFTPAQLLKVPAFVGFRPHS